MRSLPPESALSDRRFEDQWFGLLRRSQQTNTIYASPPWVSHLAAQENVELHVWSIEDSESKCLVGIACATLADYSLRFSLRNRTLFKWSRPSVHLLGSQPFFDASIDQFGDLIDAIFEHVPQANSIYGHAIPTDSPFYRYLRQSTGQNRPYFTHIVSGPRPWHLLEIKPDMDEYLDSFSSKTRESLRRKERQLEKQFPSEVRLERITNMEDVPEFLRCASLISRNSWQFKVLGERVKCNESSHKAFMELARRGLLRSYLLRTTEEPLAFVVGYQDDTVFHYAEPGFHQNFRKFSPGTVLMCRMLDDLHEFNPPNTINFGVGDATYKRRFGNCERQDVSCLIMRNNFSNRAIHHAHSLFMKSLKVAKRLANRRVTK